MAGGRPSTPTPVCPWQDVTLFYSTKCSTSQGAPLQRTTLDRAQNLESRRQDPQCRRGRLGCPVPLLHLKQRKLHNAALTEGQQQSRHYRLGPFKSAPGFPWEEVQVQRVAVVF